MNLIRQFNRLLLSKFCGAVAERLRHRSREQKVPSSSPRLDISVEVTKKLLIKIQSGLPVCPERFANKIENKKQKTLLQTTTMDKNYGKTEKNGVVLDTTSNVKLFLETIWSG